MAVGQRIQCLLWVESGRVAAGAFMFVQATQALACEFDRPVETPAQAQTRVVNNFKHGMTVGIVRANYQNGMLSLEIVKSYDPRLSTGIRWSWSSKTGLFAPCTVGLQPGESALMWVDPDPRLLPGRISKEDVEILLAAGLLTDQTVLDQFR